MIRIKVKRIPIPFLFCGPLVNLSRHYPLAEFEKVRTEAGFSWKSYAGLAASLIVPSLSLFKKFSPVFLILYLGLSVVFLFLYSKYFYPFVRARVNPPRADFLSFVTVAVLVAFFVVIYSRIDTQGFSLFGIRVGAADTDNGLQTAVELLTKGKYPYSGQIFTGQPISQMPGSLLLAAPFLFLRYTAFQNFFWIVMFLFLGKNLFKDSRPALLMVWALILFSPVFLVHLLTGVDSIANSLSILTFLLLLKTSAERHAPPYQKYLFAALLGLSLSSRINFILLVPLIFFAIAKLSGLFEAVKMTLVSLLTFLLVTLPFYFYDPQGFTPLYTLHTIQFSKVFKYGQLLVPCIAGVASVLLGILTDNSRTSTFLKNCALVQAVLVLGTEIGHFVLPGGNDPLKMTWLLQYGVFFMFFGVLGFGLDIFKSEGDSLASKHE